MKQISSKIDVLWENRLKRLKVPIHKILSNKYLSIKTLNIFELFEKSNIHRHCHDITNLKLFLNIYFGVMRKLQKTFASKPLTGLIQLCTKTRDLTDNHYQVIQVACQCFYAKNTKRNKLWLKPFSLKFFF